MKKSDKKSTGIFIKPIGLLIIVISSIFASAVLVHLILSIFPRLSRENFAFLDAGLMSVILFPVIYYLVFDPLKSYIRELEQSEEALQVSEAKYRSLVETTDDSIYLVNRNCEYLFMNAKHRSRMGFFGDEYGGRAYGEFHSPEETQEFTEEVNKVFETGQSLQHEHRSQRDGKYFLRTLSPVKGPDRAVFAISVVSKNVDKVKQTDIWQ
jgi:PAS domain S-box-containing protein